MLRIIKKRKKGLFLFKLFLLVFVTHTAVSLANQQISIDKKRRNLEELREQVRIQKIKNDSLKEIVMLDSEKQKKYIEHIARSCLDLCKKGERVFVNVSGGQK